MNLKKTVSNFIVLSLSILSSSFSTAEEYELIGINNVVPSKINERGTSVGQTVGFESTSYYIDQSGATSTIISNGGNLQTYIKDITDNDSIVGSIFGKFSVVAGNFHPLRGTGFLDFPGDPGTDEIFDYPIFAIDKDNAVGECYNGSAGSYFSAAACGYVNGTFKLFALSLDATSSSPDKEYLFLRHQSANAINDNDVVVGEAIINYDPNFSADNKNQIRAFSWTQSGGAVDLGTLGGKDSSATDINSANTIVGQADTYYDIEDINLRQAFFKKAGQPMTEILLVNKLISRAEAINDAGTIAGTVEYGSRQDLFNTNKKAFVKLASKDIEGETLDTLVHPMFRLLNLTTATDINNHGEIVGSFDIAQTNNLYSGYIARPLPSILKPFPFTGGRSTRGSADFLIWRPSTGTWYALRPSLSGTSIALTDTLVKQWGLSGDIPLFGTDFDGDKIDDLTVWRPSTGTWYACLSSKGFDCTQGTSTQFGLPGDIPLVADFDRDGKSDYVIYRRSLPQAGIIGRWYVKRSSDAVITSQQWGLAEDYPIQGDFNGDGYSDFSVFRPSTATWYINYSNQNTNTPTVIIAKQFGLPGDHPMPRDVDTDGATDIVVYRPSTSSWFSCVSSKQFECFKSDNSLNNPYINYGLHGDLPILRNVLGGETVPHAVWRPADTFYKNEGGWYTNIPESNPVLSLRHWGLRSDIPAGVGIRDLLLLTGQEKKAR